MRFTHVLGGLLVGMTVACVPPAQLHPQGPGDYCSDACPEGMRCWGEVHQRGGQMVSPGRCALEPGRCLESADCGPGEQCVRTSAHPGLCGPSIE